MERFRKFVVDAFNFLMDNEEDLYKELITVSFLSAIIEAYLYAHGILPHIMRYASRLSFGGLLFAVFLDAWYFSFRGLAEGTHPVKLRHVVNTVLFIYTFTIGVILMYAKSIQLFKVYTILFVVTGMFDYVLVILYFFEWAHKNIYKYYRSIRKG